MACGVISSVLQVLAAIFAVCSNSIVSTSEQTCQAFTASECVVYPVGDDWFGDAENPQECQDYCRSFNINDEVLCQFYQFLYEVKEPEANCEVVLMHHQYRGYLSSCNRIAGPEQPAFGECWRMPSPCDVSRAFLKLAISD